MREKYIKIIFQCSLIKFYWNTATPVLLHTVHGCFYLQWQNWVIMAETIWPGKPKKFTIWPITKIVCLPLLYRDLSSKATDYIAILCQSSERHVIPQKSNQGSHPGFIPSYLCNHRSDLTLVGPCFLPLIPHYRANSSSQIICSREGLMMVVKEWIGWLKCPFITTTD